MKKKKPSQIRLMDRKSVGAFNPKAWLGQGNRLFATANLNRDMFKRRRRNFSKKMSQRIYQPEEKSRIWNELEGCAQSSWLLMGYAVEMYLKSGLAKLYVGCAESMFKRDVRSRFVHDLEKIACEIAFHSDAGDTEIFQELRKMLSAGRYPQIAGNVADHMTKVNDLTRKQWNEGEFKILVGLAKRVRKHVTMLDNDKKNMAYIKCVSIDEDGYLAFRRGGHLPTRITYRVSSEQKEAGETTLRDVIDLFQQNTKYLCINRSWPHAKIFEDGEQETIPQEFKPAS